jgi:hypothetical protein
MGLGDQTIQVKASWTQASLETRSVNSNVWPQHQTQVPSQVTANMRGIHQSSYREHHSTERPTMMCFSTYQVMEGLEA